MKLILTYFILLQSCLLFSTALNWNLNTIYSVTQSGFSSIISDAKVHFSTNPNDTIVININAGTYNIGGSGSIGIFISALNPGANGKLIIKGAGMSNTTLVFTDYNGDINYAMIRMVNSSNITFTDMHMTRPNYTVTQGFVHAVGTGYIDLDIQNGFPTPLSLYNNNSDQGRYLRRYTNSLTDPQVIQTNNNQIAWGYPGAVYTPPTLISGNIWRIYLNSPSLVASNYSIGELVGVKSKHEGNTYFISGGHDILFENIKWTHISRGVSRYGTYNLTIRKCRIERGLPINGQTPCLATPSGGFQMNQPNDAVSTNMIVDSCYIDSPGDDCVAFFNVNGSKVINSELRNSFARGVYIISAAQNICIANTIIHNNPILGTYATCPIVYNTNDSGIGSLRAAITNVADGGKIDFDPSVLKPNDTIHVTSAALEINKNIDITQDAESVVKIKSTGTHAIFNILAGKSLTLANVDIFVSPGIPNVSGRAIQNNGTLQVSDVSIFEPSQNTSGSGSTLQCSTGSTLNITSTLSIQN